MTLNYQIALTIVPFDNSYKNVLRFDTRSEQEAYFKVNTLFSNSPEVNFNVGSLYATNVIYDCKENDSINELLNKNYVIVKDNSSTATYKYYYYFVTNAIQQGGERISMSLELDIFQTYYIDLKFSDSTIFKSHLNRFIDNGDGTISFDGTPTSKLFEREDVQNVAKRLTKREVVSQYPDTELGNWFKENVIAWAYIYVDPFHDFNVVNVDRQNTTIRFRDIYNESKKGGPIMSNIAVLCFPIVRKELYLNVTETEGSFRRRWGIYSYDTENNPLKAFLNGNEDTETGAYGYIYSMKVSSTSPILNWDNISYRIDSSLGELSIDAETRTFDGYFLNPLFSYFGRSCYCNLAENYGVVTELRSQANFVSAKYEINKEFTFTKNSIKNSNKNPKFNPKLLSSDYSNLTISDATENGFEYDIQKLNKKNIEIKLTEPFVPDISKKYIRISNNEGVYIKDTEDNLTGFVNSNDKTLVMPTPAFKSMLSNNKNYFLQNSINRIFGLTQGAMSSGLAIAGGISGGNPLSSIGGGIGIINTGLNYAKQRINENLTIDNLKNAPSNIVGAKGNAIFESMYSENGIIVEEWDILENEKEMINDFMCMYGFTYNRIDNVKNVDNIRKYYNYVRADIEAIHGVNISERVHQKFRECFANGVRFWNTDTFSYEKENYERWLDND